MMNRAGRPAMTRPQIEGFVRREIVKVIGISRPHILTDEEHTKIRSIVKNITATWLQDCQIVREEKER